MSPRSVPLLKPWRRPLKLAGAAALVAVVALLSASAFVEQRYADRIVRAAAAPVSDVAVVFGAGLEPGSEPSPILKERLDAAVSLYQAHKVRTVLMSGDSSDKHHDETKAMRRFALERGVAESDLLEDPAGTSTFETCYRAANVYRVKRALLVSQEFHLPRALFIAESVGMDAYGVAADEEHPGHSPYEVRELLSRPLALVMVLFRGR